MFMTVDQLLAEVIDERKSAVEKLRQTILDNLPDGFEETVSYGMISYVVPHSIYPKGYHCDPKIPLPFLSFASQKNSLNLYHMGIYADKDLYKWFTDEFPLHCSQKLDMGKSCIRFKKVNDIPFELIGQLVQKMTPKQWIEIYEQAFKKK
ncbi:MAG: DUF1801 domain-containing protein [Crocinitomicaceae bacterium]